MDRKELDAFAAHHNLSERDLRAAYEIVGAQPDAAETRAFLIRLLRIAGVLSLAAGVVFFVAANWQDFRVFGRFALIETVLVVSLCLAIWRPAPLPIGRYALLMAFITTGALLALFGQTYQTGADLYELFLTWAVLGLPLVLASQWAVTWAAWLLVLNTSLTLFCVARPVGGWLWIALGRWDLNLVELLLVPTVVNLGLWALTESLRSTRWRDVATAWLGRVAFLASAAFATSASMVAIFDHTLDQEGVGFAIGVLLILTTVTSAYVLMRRRDVFPVATLTASFIVIGTCLIAEHTDMKDIGMFFLLALWLIASSTLAGRWLMSLVRAWTREAV